MIYGASLSIYNRQPATKRRGSEIKTEGGPQFYFKLLLRHPKAQRLSLCESRVKRLEKVVFLIRNVI